LLLRLGRVSHLWFGSEFGNFPLKIPNFSIFTLWFKKNYLGQVKGYPGQPLIYCRSKVSLSRVRAHLYSLANHVEMGSGQNFSTRVGSFFDACVVLSSLWAKLISSGWVKKYSAQRWISPLFTPGEKYACAGSAHISKMASLPFLSSHSHICP